MDASRRTNRLAGLAALIIGLVVMLRALDLLPDNLYDALLRAWPGLLVLLGLSVFLGPRLRLGGLLALLITAVVTGGIVAVAFSSRAGEDRDDYRENIAQPVDPEVTLLRVQVRALTTDIELLRGPSADRVINGAFTGSRESVVQVNYDAEAPLATLRIEETRPNPFPALADIGRGRLRVELPPDVPLDIDLIAADGAVLFNLDGLALERLNIDLAQGDALVTLPVYQPLGTPRGEVLGTLAVRDGDVTLFIPQDVSARLDLERAGGRAPIYDPTIYNALFNNTVVEARNIDTAAIALRYVLVVPQGQIEIRIP